MVNYGAVGVMTKREELIQKGIKTCTTPSTFKETYRQTRATGNPRRDISTLISTKRKRARGYGQELTQLDCTELGAIIAILQFCFSIFFDAILIAIQYSRSSNSNCNFVFQKKTLPIILKKIPAILMALRASPPGDCGKIETLVAL